ncbi:MAG: hypothetical protein AMXMBFR61_22180 [Fimbriimonadales bacterium]
MDISESMRITLTEWLDLISREYLADYVPSGGSAVRFVSGADSVINGVINSLKEDARSRDMHVVFLDPALLCPDGRKPDYHRIENVFFGVARSFDWRSLADRHLRTKMHELGYVIPSDWLVGGDLTQFLRANDLDHEVFVTELKRALRADIVQDRAMALEFRAAVSALGYHRIVPDSHLPTTEDVVLRWLLGAKAEPGDSKVLEGYQIYGRISRSNARHMLVSLCHWLPKAGYSGLLLLLDFRPYEYKKPSRSQIDSRRLQLEVAWERERRHKLEDAITRGTPPDQLVDMIARLSSTEDPITQKFQLPEVAYSGMAYMHMVHLLRAFLDEIELFSRLFLVVLTTEGYYDTAAPRNYRDYDALQTRIANEVRGERGNPEGILCHLKEDL